MGTTEQFSPEYLLDWLQFSSERLTLEIANIIEAAVHIWKKKDEQRPFYRALRHHFPGLLQTALDMNKIRYNKVYTVPFHLSYMY